MGNVLVLIRGRAPETWTEHTQANPLAKLLQTIISLKLFFPATSAKPAEADGLTPSASDRPVVIDRTFIG
jgi:hypothetical protein